MSSLTRTSDFEQRAGLDLLDIKDVVGKIQSFMKVEHSVEQIDSSRALLQIFLLIF